MGKIDYGKKSSEIGNIKFRRSLYITKTLSSGDTITKDHVKSIRPGYGLPPKYLDDVIGMKVNKNKFEGDPLQSIDIKDFQFEGQKYNDSRVGTNLHKLKEGSIETTTHDIEWLFPRNLYARWVNMNELIYTPEQLEEKYNK